MPCHRGIFSFLPIRPGTPQRTKKLPETPGARRPWRALAPLLVITLILPMLLGAGCGPGREEILVFSAASMRDVLTPLGKEYSSQHNLRVRFSFGGSVTLAQQILRGAPADLFLPAGAYPMDLLEEEGLLAPDSRRELVTNELVLIVASGRGEEDATLREALSHSKRVALADPQLAPAGRYTREALQNLGLWEGLEFRLVFGGDVRTALAYVESGNVDAGIVYRTDALTSGKVEVALVMPKGAYPAITYPVAVLRRSNHQEESARFVEFLLGETSASQFQRYGFGIANGP